MRRRTVDLSILLLVLSTGVVGVYNARAIGDWWHAQRYTPSKEIAKLADDAGMSEAGKRLFYRFSPQLVDQKELDAHCDVEKLGCAEGQSIYILQHQTDAEYNRTIVTAAHEMLHIAYSRLKPDEQATLQPLLKDELDRPTASKVNESLKGYDTADYNNEAHSFIGSQLAVKNTELNDHYTKYFVNRDKAIEAYKAYPKGY